jgi:MFS superfamily sulfate permease-like transporter
LNNPFAESFKNLKEHWKEDIIAGVTVAFVGLPLALGIALASGLPLSSGIIAALVGGLLVSQYNGAHITVNGPPKATIIVTLAAITTFGGGLQGIEITLAVFFLVGIFMVLFGLFKFGDLGDFFPSSAVQGMLSAVGMMIIMNQIHLLFGKNPDTHDIVDLIKLIPISILEMNPYVGVIGVTSLTFLFIYPYLKGKFLHMIPAPMWVVFYASIMGYLLNFGTERVVEYNGVVHQIGPNLLIRIPENLGTSFLSPDFGMITEIGFWTVVINITFITALESLMSAKGVDRIDPERRVTDLNKNLIGTGAGTMLSSFLGGLPVISQVLTSTVAANNGGRTKWTTFFNGLTILIAVVFFVVALNRIPLAALAAILVHTGYKLTSIKVIRRTYEFGKEQLFIFLVTMLVTLISDLVIGVIAGIFTTFIIHSFAGVDKKYWFGLLFKSTNHFHYDEEDDHYYISVRRFANFFNYLGLKKELMRVPPRSHLILDFSHARLIDHTVMDHIAIFADRYRSGGGVFEIVGLDLHKPSSNHPLSGRRIVEGYVPSEKKYNITKRQRQLKRVSYKNSWTFNLDTDWQIGHLKAFPFFQTKILHFQTNAIRGENFGERFAISDISFASGAMEASIDQRMTLMIQNLKTPIPQFTIEKEKPIDKVLSLAGQQDIDFDAYPEFSYKFLLKGRNEKEIRKFFNRELIIFFETHSIFHIECNGYQIMIFEKVKLSKAHEVEIMTEFIKQLWTHIQ